MGRGTNPIASHRSSRRAVIFLRRLHPEFRRKKFVLMMLIEECARSPSYGGVRKVSRRSLMQRRSSPDSPGTESMSTAEIAPDGSMVIWMVPARWRAAWLREHGARSARPTRYVSSARSARVGLAHAASSSGDGDALITLASTIVGASRPTASSPPPTAGGALSPSISTMPVHGTCELASDTGMSSRKSTPHRRFSLPDTSRGVQGPRSVRDATKQLRWSLRGGVGGDTHEGSCSSIADSTSGQRCSGVTEESGFAAAERRPQLVNAPIEPRRSSTGKKNVYCAVAFTAAPG